LPGFALKRWPLFSIADNDELRVRKGFLHARHCFDQETAAFLLDQSSDKKNLPFSILVLKPRECSDVYTDVMNPDPVGGKALLLNLFSDKLGNR
jgi:hypothetical protein